MMPSPARSVGEGGTHRASDGRVRVIAMAVLSRKSRDAARQLRRSTTEAERALWRILRSRQLAGYKFRRQHPLGPFVLDFACIAERVAVEADGGQHAENEEDARRTVWLVRQGWRLLRLWNNDILVNPEGVADRIVGFIRAPNEAARL
ncbi:MAG: endonuclease domain-containing protein [Stellaceae bacterium]